MALVDDADVLVDDPAIADADPSSPLTADDLRRIVEAAVADEVRARVRVTVDTDDE